MPRFHDLGKHSDPGMQAGPRKKTRTRWEMERDAFRDARRRWLDRNLPWLFAAAVILTAAMKWWLYPEVR